MFLCSGPVDGPRLNIHSVLLSGNSAFLRSCGVWFCLFMIYDDLNLYLIMYLCILIPPTVISSQVAANVSHFPWRPSNLEGGGKLSTPSSCCWTIVSKKKSIMSSKSGSGASCPYPTFNRGHIDSAANEPVCWVYLKKKKCEVLQTLIHEPATLKDLLFPDVFIIQLNILKTGSDPIVWLRRITQALFIYFFPLKIWFFSRSTLSTE